ncbi:DUF4856 domain-containing protein [Flavobacterium sp. H122]|uniref:DUF4856 domain-containing protein n=1 Tax=Flavobacterium sp. H122 TaxID=2529860 RepID=UPI0010AB49F7|nr:DUF4856 domain-containing protein [Flavobacterium sp. H122]
MNFKNALLASLPVMAIFVTSCSDDNQPEFNYTVPETYTFERNAATTVDFGGQTNRIKMLDEMGNYIKDQAASASLVDDAKLSNMYANVNAPFANADLNAATTKQLKDKTAASKDFFGNFGGGGSTDEQINVRAFFETQFDNAKAASNGDAAAAGVAGVYLDGSSKRLYAANGLEPQQIMLKGLMGACFMDQIVNNYLSLAVLDEGSNKKNNDDKVLDGDKNYTKMEHLWDEAYGYVYGADVAGASPVYKFWSSYINQVDADSDFGTVKEDINLAFRKGRAAIVAGDYVTRNEQIKIIKNKLALVAAVRAVYYLKEGKAKLTAGDNGIKAFHALSEGYGFIMSLRYTNKPGTNNPFISKDDVDAILTELMGGTNGLWDLDYLNNNLDGLALQIANKFGFTVAQAQTVN